MLTSSRFRSIYILGVCLGFGAAGCSVNDETPWLPSNGADAGPEAQVEPGADAGSDSKVEPGADAGSDSNVEPGADAGSDSNVEPGADAGSDSNVEPGPDGGPEASAESGADAPVGPGQKLIFEDTFDQSGSTPDPAKWTLCHKSTPAWAQYLSESYDQAYVEGGKLILRGEKIGGVYKTGGVMSMGKFDFTYGKAEINARFTTAQGGWPAIWMLSAGGEWPAGGEIDIMEMVNHETVVHQTVHSHYTYDLGQKDPPQSATTPYEVGQFNTYAVDWTPEELVFSVNGTVSLTYPNLHLANEATMLQWPFDGPFYLILNFALGGPWPGEITDAQLPVFMEVDWVRVTQLE